MHGLLRKEETFDREVQFFLFLESRPYLSIPLFYRDVLVLPECDFFLSWRLNQGGLANDENA